MRFSFLILVALAFCPAAFSIDINPCVSRGLNAEEERLTRMEEADKQRYIAQLKEEERKRQEAPKLAEQIAKQKEESYRLAGEYDQALKRPANIAASITSKGDVAVVRSSVFQEKLGTDEVLVRVLGNSGRDMNNRQMVEVEVYGGLKKGEKFTVSLHENQVKEWTSGHHTPRAQELMRQGDAEVRNKVVSEVQEAFKKGNMELTGDEVVVARSMNFNLKPNDTNSRIVLDLVQTNDYTRKERVSLHFVKEEANGRKVYQAKSDKDSLGRDEPGEKFYINKGESRIYKMGKNDYDDDIPIYSSIQRAIIP